jgi:competence protein ComEC
LVDGSKIRFDQPPVKINQRVLVPIRYVAEQIGCSVEWDEKTQTVYINTPGVPVKKTASSTENINVYVNNEQIVFTDQQPVSMGGRTLLPVRFVAERLGYNVSWDEDTQTVSMTSIVKTGLQSGLMTVHFIDVGQGSAIFIDYGEFEMLIDSGNFMFGRTVIDYMREFVDGAIEIVVVTHPHDDHIADMPYIFNAFDVDIVIYNGETPDTSEFREFDLAVNVVGRENLIVARDMTIQIGRNAELHIFAPMKVYDRRNDNSVVVKLQYGRTSVLFTGDIEAEAERDLLNRLSKVNVLKVAHHGSKSSSTTEFLNAIRPEYAIISSGRHSIFGHPHRETMERLLAARATVYGTYKEGTIIMTIDNNGYRINAETPLTLNNAGGI